MNIVVLGATGGVGREIVQAALAGGNTVRALVRDPANVPFETNPNLEIVRADVHDETSIRSSIASDDVVLSGLGLRGRSDVGTLTAGARAVVASASKHIVWLGAMGTGESSALISTPIAWALRRAFGPEYGDKVTADSTIVDAGGTVVLSGPLSDKPDDPTVALAALAGTPHQFFPVGAPRSSIARLMLGFAAEPAPGFQAVQPRRAARPSR